MHNIDFIRKHPEEFDKGLARRGHLNTSKEILELDEQRRKLTTELQELQKSRNEESARGATIKDKKGAEFAKLKEEVKKINQDIESIKEKEKEAADALLYKLERLPNILEADVPDGSDEDSNVMVSKHGTPRKFSFTPKPHYELGEALGQMDFVETAKVSGSRFVTLKDDLARLEKALARFMLDIHTKEADYHEVSPPLLVLPSAMYGAGQLPKFQEESFVTTNDYWLAPTSEVALMNFVANSIVDEDKLPLRYTAFTANFRSEAGSAGKDTRGMIRQHQFYKVEMVCICSESQYLSEYARMMESAEKVLERLELPYQKILKCVGDTGFHAEKTHDYEVWLPSQNCYREISSCSICGQFQTRRMKARYRRSDSRDTEYLYAMNGTGIATGRTIVAILENFQEADGSIRIPDALHKYMDGQTVIEATQ